MLNFKTKLEALDKKYSELREEEYRLYKEASDAFNKHASKMLSCGDDIKCMKYKLSDNDIVYFLFKKTDSIESRVYKTHTGLHHFVHVDGLIIKFSNGKYIITNEFVGYTDFLINFLDYAVCISDDEFKEVVSKWWVEHNDYYNSWDEELEPEPDWFNSLDYYKIFVGLEDFLPKNETNN